MSALFKFYTDVLEDKDTDRHSVVSMMGLASFRVTNSYFLTSLKETFGTDAVEAEFSYVRNKHLHYKPTFSEDRSFGSGLLTVRVDGDIVQFNLTVITGSGSVLIKRVDNFINPGSSMLTYMLELPYDTSRKLVWFTTQEIQDALRGRRE